MEDRLNSIREQIKECDRQVLQTLKKRFDLCLQVKNVKEQMDLETYQPSREQILRDFWLEQADDLLSANFLNSLLDLILQESKNLQGK